MEKWNTLAFSYLGTHKMRFKETLEKNEAEETGRAYCKNKSLDYVGTFSNDEIDYEEEKLRLELYS